MSEVAKALDGLRERLGREPNASELIAAMMRGIPAETTAPADVVGQALELLQAEVDRRSQKRPIGRPPIFDRPMTSSERNKRAKERLKARCGDLEQALAEAVDNLEVLREFIGGRSSIPEAEFDPADTALVNFLGRCRKLLG